MHDHDARSDGADHAAAVPTARERPGARPRSGGALATLAALGLVVAVSIGVAAAQGSGQGDNLRLAQTAITV